MDMDDGILIISLLEMLLFSIDNGTSRHSKNCNNSFLVLGERPTDYTNHSVGKKCSALT